MFKNYINKVLKYSFNERYIFNMNALMVAIENNKNGEFEKEIDEIIEKHPQMINEYDVYGLTPLMHAIQQNDLVTAEKLIDKVEFYNSFEAETVFMIAHSFCSDRILMISLSRIEQFTRFPFLTKDLSEEVAKHFVSKIPKTMIFEENWTPLMLSIMSNRKNVSKELILQEHNIHHVNDMGHNAFDYCLSEELGRLLYYYDSSPNVYFELYNYISHERDAICSFLDVSDIATDIMEYLV